jgi:peptide deformylase
MGFVKRPSRIRVDYLDRQGNSQSMLAEGNDAHVLLHEFEHLMGRQYDDCKAGGGWSSFTYDCSRLPDP